MKKIIALFLCGVLLLGTTGCSRKEISSDIKKLYIGFRQKITNTVRITFPEGYSVIQIGKKLESNGICTLGEFIEEINLAEYISPGLTGDIDNPAQRPYLLEGYLFPATYDFIQGEGAKKAVSRLLGSMKTKITPEITARCKELDMNIDDILTVASIIEKEGGIPSEMGKVSSVIHNRLHETYNRLGCDATVTYLNRYVEGYSDGGREKYNGYYNTYKCYGLPAGPICNPGMAAINAALYPEDTDYLFFCSDKSNNYYYAHTYEGHVENCKRAGIL